MTDTFVKSGPNPLGEAAGLRWLAEAQVHGGARVADVVDVTAERLETRRIDAVMPSSESARAFGSALARTHAEGAAWWGCPPDAWQGPAWVGSSRTPLVMSGSDVPETWGQFYARHRIEEFARRLRDDAVIDEHDVRLYTRLAERLDAGNFDVAQPRLVHDAGHAVARVHGDMWSGNVLYDGSLTGAALIDPMAHGGHAETDLATLSVFGFPLLDEIYSGYDESSPLAEGWRERIGLHQLAIVIMHAHLFEGSYVAQAARLASQYV